MYKFDIMPLLWLCAAVGSLFIGVIWFLCWAFGDDDIRTDKPIKPIIELTTNGKKIDTVYVYRKP